MYKDGKRSYHMSDIFISYKREEQAIARKLADALEGEGWSVWWDPKLRAGERFNDVIEKALKESKCVVVMWSKRSVQSLYVRDEATYAMTRQKLIPVRIEEVELPFRFEELHTPSLIGWDRSHKAPAFRTLVDDISAILDPQVTTSQKAQSADKKQSAWQGQPQKDESNDIAVSKPDAARTNELQLEEFRKKLEKDAALYREVIGPKLPPAPPLIGFSLSVTENARSNDPKLVIEVENKTTEPMYRVEIWVNATQLWSTVQQAFVSRSNLKKRVLLNTPKILEPDNPTRVFLLTKASKGLLLISDRDAGEGGGLWLEMPGKYRLELLIKTANAETKRDLFVIYEPEEVPRFISDPRLKHGDR